ncbi:hypothetical protein [Dyadobacter psychrophilus]|uniref:Uncharacterized protein n=1 Tax=Dyadobacter psychrophilus TaxID=651661 RepID=A0A1T5GZQ6_9BACT|nr:hypothetical protein [Dyadobacter psychrophilus]SKC13922.1 hypothetical protein SAMN05660293_04675 [Dyadobacter psychrophilus]
MNAGLLRKCSVCYLMLPNLLFGLGWFRQPYSVLLTIGFVYLLYLELKKEDRTEKLTAKSLVFVFIFSIICVFFCGIGGFSKPSFDWLAHNTKFYDLFKNNWPIYFPEVDRYACYYYGYYLLPAFTSKIYGQLLPSVFVFWTFLGFFLGFAWVLLLVGQSRLMLLLFLFMRGVGQLIFSALKLLNLSQIHAPIFNPSIRSIFEQNAFTPNQVIPSLIGSGILLYDFIYRKKIDETFFVVILVFVWAVFPALSLLAVFGAVFIHKYVLNDGWRAIDRRTVIVSYLIPGLAFLPVFAYFLSSQTLAIQGFLWDFKPAKHILLSYATGLLIDFALFYIVIIYLNKLFRIFPKWFINTVFGLLFALSLYRMGIYNDLFFRGSIPLCIILFIGILRGFEAAIRSGQWPGQKHFYLASSSILFLIISLIYVKSDLLRENKIASQITGEEVQYRTFRYTDYPNIYQALRNGYKDPEGAKQYLGSPNSIYEKYLSRQHEGVEKSRVQRL